MATRKTWDELDITDDYLFKLVMKHKHICKSMIEKILRIKIRDLRYIEEERMNYMTFEMKLNEEREEGRREGRIKGFEEIAIKLLHNKTPILEIQTLTGLPESRILELAKENNLL